LKYSSKQSTDRPTENLERQRTSSMSKDPYKNLEFLDVLIQQDPEWEAEEVLVVIGDETVKFDEDFPYDERVYFHFDNKEQFEQAKTEMLEDVGFIVLKVLDDETGENE
jgi:hypothetical protein